MANESVLQRIELLKETGARNLILLGEEKKLQLSCALELAASWLKTTKEELAVHPDYKFLEPIGGSIRVEQAEQIQQMASYVPVSDQAVCVVNDAETMTIELQNKLLKVLEDGEKTLAVIFVTGKPLLDTIASRCISIEFQKTSLAELYGMGCNFQAALLGCDGSKELYDQVVTDDWFFQYLEGFYKSFCGIKERSQLKNILKLTHALRENDAEYLPSRLEEWQMSVFLCMIKQMFWHVLLSKTGLTMPNFIRLGNLESLYEPKDAEIIYRKADEAWRLSKKKGKFSKNDFFELLMYMIPV